MKDNLQIQNSPCLFVIENKYIVKSFYFHIKILNSKGQSFKYWSMIVNGHTSDIG